jgi:SAM-dependent methyltransferase
MEPSIRIIETNCRCCGSSQRRVLETGLRDIEEGAPGEYDIAKCETCGLVYLSRSPDAASLSACYPDDYYTRSEKHPGFISKTLYRLKHRARYKALVRQVRQPDSLLEVGCGNGAFLAYLETRWPAVSLYGTDISFGQTKVPNGSRIHLVESSAETLDLKQTFDVVLMHHALEHFAEPAAALSRIAAHLKPGGTLAGEVPNWNSPWRRIFPRHWGGLQVPRHQSFFEAATLTLVFARAGLAVERIIYTADPGDLSVSLGNWLADKLHLTTRPRQSWAFLPLIVACAPIVAAHVAVSPRRGSLGFVARRK